jgi:hypothetical protein
MYTAVTQYGRALWWGKGETCYVMVDEGARKLNPGSDDVAKKLLRNGGPLFTVAKNYGE